MIFLILFLDDLLCNVEIAAGHLLLPGYHVCGGIQRM